VCSRSPIGGPRTNIDDYMGQTEICQCVSDRLDIWCTFPAPKRDGLHFLIVWAGVGAGLGGLTATKKPATTAATLKVRRHLVCTRTICIEEIRDNLLATS
jgi:hypothetical protein